MDLFNFFKSNNNPSIDLNDYKFISDDHSRFENGKKINANNKGAWRGIRIQTLDNKTFTVTIYNLTGDHPIWGNNIQMAPKQMKILEDNKDKIHLRGFGHDAMGSSFADYGITLIKNDTTVESIKLHMFDRNIEIVYSKGNPNDMKKEVPLVNQQPKESNFTELYKFKLEWITMPMQQKMMIAMESDTLNNKGVVCYQNGDIDSAIVFYNKALEIMPINDDAIKNLRVCYSKKNNLAKVREMEDRLKFVSA